MSHSISDTSAPVTREIFKKLSGNDYFLGDNKISAHLLVMMLTLNTSLPLWQSKKLQMQSLRKLRYGVYGWYAAMTRLDHNAAD